MRTTLIASIVTATLVLPAAVGLGLDGEDGYVASLLLTPGDARSEVDYDVATAPVRWQDLAHVEFWAPIGPGQRDGLAANAAGDLYYLLRGRATTDGSGPEYTGLVCFDGSSHHHLLQDRMSSGQLQTRTGESLDSVIVSPTSTGPLTAGHPVLLRHVISEPAGVRTFHAEVVSIDPASGAEVLIHRFGAEAAQARVAIDGSGGAADGTVYVGPLGDGTVARLDPSGSGYSVGVVPGTFRAAEGLLVDDAGDILTFRAGADWGGLVSPYPDQHVYALDPGTGVATVRSSVDGRSFVFDWTVDDGGALWFGLRESSGKRRRCVVAAPSGSVASSRNRISDSSSDPWSLTAGPDGALYVLEGPFSAAGAIHLLSPGETGSGGGGGKGKKNK